jgi:hypothetical protein
MIAAGLLTGCANLYTKRVIFRNHPISLRVGSKVIDEEYVEYFIAFRNVGRDIMSFDYTIADEPGVPHVDRDGPNSGLIENLYPGAEVEVKNPRNRMAIWATVGTVTYGKKSPEQLEAIYRSEAVMRRLQAQANGDAEGVVAPIVETSTP